MTVTNGGAGFLHPVVAFTGGTVDATATVFGGVDAVTLADPGTGYTFPTVDFDLPDDPDGIQAHGARHVREAAAPIRTRTATPAC